LLNFIKLARQVFLLAFGRIQCATLLLDNVF